MKFEDLKTIDKQKMYATYDNWPEIAKESFERDIQKCEIKDVDHIVFAGMGGSGSIGDSISAILSKKNIHVTNIKGYLLPKTVDEKTLVITTSVSGNTTECIEILKNFRHTPAKFIGFSSGGLLEKYCKENQLFFQKISMEHSPRASYSRFLYSILNILEPIIPIKKNEINESISSLEKTKKKIFSENLTDENISLKLAEFTSDIVSIYYPRGLQAPAIRYKNCLQENAKIHAMTEDIIESCHNGIVAWEKESNVKPILIQGKDDHKKTSERWKILEEFFNMNEINYMKINSVEGNILSKIINLTYLLDYSTIYTAVLSKIDPSPVKSIDYIKSKL
tara:strand:- start:12672 stop:13679 length:1008 start_codon:yes stop_codon:yes gene_type:complete